MPIVQKNNSKQINKEIKRHLNHFVTSPLGVAVFKIDGFFYGLRMSGITDKNKGSITSSHNPTWVSCEWAIRGKTYSYKHTY